MGYWCLLGAEALILVSSMDLVRSCATWTAQTKGASRVTAYILSQFKARPNMGITSVPESYLVNTASNRANSIDAGG